MMNILILTKRNFLIFLNNIVINLFLYFLFPIFTYLIIVSPLSNIFTKIMNSGMSYTYHSVPGVIFVCTSMLALMIPISLLNRDKNNNLLSYILSTNVDSNSYFSSILLFTLICSFFEFIISMFLSIQLSGSGSLVGFIISWNQILYFSIAILPCIFFFSTLGMLLSHLTNKNENIIVILIFFFLIISFGSATFIPVNYYSAEFALLIEKYNIITDLYEMFIAILNNSNVSIGTIIITLFLSIIFYVLNIILFIKKDKIK